MDESFKGTLWLQRAASVLNPSDSLVSPYMARAVPTVQQALNSMNQRPVIFPSDSQVIDAARTIMVVQKTLSGKR